MAINVTLGEAKTQENKKFPKIMQHEDGSIFYFSKNEEGIMLLGEESECIKIGVYTKTIIMAGFTDYNEPITLQNK